MTQLVIASLCQLFDNSGIYSLQATFKPSEVFISYCHENADRDAIELFQKKLEEDSKGSVIFYRDNTSRVGQKLSEHENLLDQIENVIVLLTPEYFKRIQNRTGRAYKEFSKYIARYNETIEANRGNYQTNTINIIPILFSGSEATSVPEELKEIIFRNFTRFRATTNPKTHKPIIPNSVIQNHQHDFDDILSSIAFRNVEDDTDLEELKVEKKNLLLSEEKHEVLVEKLTNKKLDDVLEQIFVKTKSFQAVAKQHALILVGRKGSGKSTITEHIHRNSSVPYKTKIATDVNDFNLELLNNIVFTPKLASDIETLFNRDRYFTLVWQIFIYIQAIRTIITETKLGANLVDIEEEAEIFENFLAENQLSINGSVLTATDQIFPDYVFAASSITKLIEEALKRTGSNAVNFNTDLARVAKSNFVLTHIFGEITLNALKGATSKCRRKFLFSLDGFDSDFDSFRRNTLDNYDNEAKSMRIDMEVSWLTGLLHAVLKLRTGDIFLNGKMDFCLTIPKDRFIEVRARDRDDYRYRNISSHIKWSGIELAILLHKRIEAIYDQKRHKNMKPLERFETHMENVFPDIPRYLRFRFGERNINLSLFCYIVRHTFWRPRDIILIFSDIVATAELLSQRRQNFNIEILRKTVSKATFGIVNSEFINEFKRVCLNIREIIDTFSQLGNILKYTEVAKLVSEIDFVFVDPRLEEHNNVEGKIQFLFEIGFLGYHNPDVDKRSLEFEFYFSEGEDVFNSIGPKERSQLEFAIHPVFNEFLRLKVDMKRPVNFYEEEYLEKNDLH